MTDLRSLIETKNSAWNILDTALKLRNRSDILALFDYLDFIPKEIISMFADYYIEIDNKQTETEFLVDFVRNISLIGAIEWEQIFAGEYMFKFYEGNYASNGPSYITAEPGKDFVRFFIHFKKLLCNDKSTTLRSEICKKCNVTSVNSPCSLCGIRPQKNICSIDHIVCCVSNDNKLEELQFTGCTYYDNDTGFYYSGICYAILRSLIPEKHGFYYDSDDDLPELTCSCDIPIKKSKIGPVVIALEIEKTKMAIQSKLLQIKQSKNKSKNKSNNKSKHPDPSYAKNVYPES